MCRWRNKLVALICVLIFLGLATLYYKGWVMKSPFSVVLVLVDEFNSQTIANERFMNSKSPKELRLDRFDQSAIVHLGRVVQGKANPGEFSSQISTGVMPGEGNLAISNNGKALVTLLDRAHASGRSTGIVTNGLLVSSSLAPFYANVKSGSEAIDILSQLVDVERADVVFGACEPGQIESTKRNLIEEFQAKRYDTANSMLDVLRRPEWKFPRIVGIFEPSEIKSSSATADPSSATLPKLVRASIRFLQYNRKGYLLVVYVAKPEDGKSPVSELEEALRSIRDFAGSNSLVVVCGLPDGEGMPSDLLSFAHGSYASDWSGTKSPTELHKLLSGHF